jgi:hypothetical protein
VHLRWICATAAGNELGSKPYDAAIAIRERSTSWEKVFDINLEDLNEKCNLHVRRDGAPGLDVRQYVARYVAPEYLHFRDEVVLGPTALVAHFGNRWSYQV